MKHLEDIKIFIDILLKSQTFHALVIESPPGWGKSSSVHRILEEMAIPHERINTYTTAFRLYHALKNYPEKIFVLDDCVGLLSDPNAVAVLKSATWPVDSNKGERSIMWGAGKVEEGAISVPFSGKLILLVNTTGYGVELRGLLSRVLFLRILTSDEDKQNLIKEAAHWTAIYPDTLLAIKVADFIIGKLADLDAGKLNLRMLRLGYELAENYPDRWEILLEKLLTGSESPGSIVQGLSRTDLPVEEQVRQFKKETGLSRRTFFNYRKSSNG